MGMRRLGIPCSMDMQLSGTRCHKPLGVKKERRRRKKQKQFARDKRALGVPMTLGAAAPQSVYSITLPLLSSAYSDRTPTQCCPRSHHEEREGQTPPMSAPYPSTWAHPASTRLA